MIYISWSKFNITNSDQMDKSDTDLILDILIKLTEEITYTSNPYTKNSVFYLDEYRVDLSDSDVFKNIRIEECPRNGNGRRPISKEEFKKLVLNVYDG